jgi:hypothetical protein
MEPDYIHDVEQVIVHTQHNTTQVTTEQAQDILHKREVPYIIPQ